MSALERGAHYDFFLKFEHRAYWNDQLLRKLNLQSDEFAVSTTRVKYSTRADSLETFLEHYDQETVRMASELYDKDIALLGYEYEVQFLTDIVNMRHLVIS
jgi:hypothetical protein